MKLSYFIRFPPALMVFLAMLTCFHLGNLFLVIFLWLNKLGSEILPEHQASDE